MPLSTLGCAVGEDGNLLDVTHIDFYNDPADLVPISSPSTRAAIVKVSSNLDSYITCTRPTHAPSDLIPNSCCSTHISHPSEKAKMAMDANPDSTVAAGAKHQAEVSLKCTNAHCHPYMKAFTDESGEDSIPTEAEAGGVSESESGGDVDDDEDEDAEAAYLDTKALGDADHLVCDFQFFS